MKVHVLLARAAVVAPALAASASTARGAEPVMVQCGREYQAARSAGTLNGMDWNAYRAACAERLKPAPVAASASAPPIVPSAPSAAAASPTKEPAPTAAPAAAVQSSGMTAMHARQKQCGAEWTSQKAALVSQTPGLTWPKYWSQCNTRIKATGR